MCDVRSRNMARSYLESTVGGGELSVLISSSLLSSADSQRSRQLSLESFSKHNMSEMNIMLSNSLVHVVKNKQINVS